VRVSVVTHGESGRWTAEAALLPGAVARETRGEAISAARAEVLRSVAEKIEAGEAAPAAIVFGPEQRRLRLEPRLVLGVLSILVAAGLAVLGLGEFRDDVVHALPGLRLVEPTPELMAHYGHSGLLPGPMVVNVGPEAASLGIGAIWSGDYFYEVEGERVANALELKRALLVHESDVTSGLWRRVSIVSARKASIQTVRMDLSALRAIPRPKIAPAWIPERLLVGTTAGLPVVVLVVIFLATRRHAQSRRLLLAWIVALGIVCTVTQFVALDILRSWGARL
jgi:hypothetical protein